MQFNDIVVGSSEKEQMKLRMAVYAPTKGGKTFTALRLAFAISDKVVAIDTERGRMSLYHGEVVDDKKWEWQKINLNPPYSIDRFRYALDVAIKTGSEVLILDSFSHEWAGEGGALDWQKNLGGRYNDWGTVTPAHNRLVDDILSCPMHTIVTMRSRMDYVVTEEESGGKKKQKVERLGLAPVQRNDVPYEFDFELELDQDHNATLRSRMAALHGWQGNKPGPEIVPPILEWLATGVTPRWMPDWGTFIRVMKGKCPELATGKTSEQIGREWGQLIKTHFEVVTWEPRLGDEAKKLLLELENNRVLEAA